MASLREYKADQHVLQYLIEKYSLTKPETHFYGPLAPGGRDSYTACGPDWTRAANNVLNIVMTETDPTEWCCIACGELAMFIRVIEPYNHDHVAVPLQERLRALRGGETYKSLLEMGRGRGGNYALQLIQRELREALAI